MAPPAPGPLPAPPAPAPLQVDTVTSVWDVLGALGDFIGGVGAAFGLVVAAVTYKRQVDDRRREQAAKVTLTEARQDGRLTLVIENGSNMPIGRVRMECSLRPESGPPGRYVFEWTSVAAHQKLVILDDLREDERAGVVSARMWFIDATGHRWTRMLDGGLYKLRKRPRRPGQLTAVPEELRGKM
jgi:hypothetical protein